MFNSLFVRSILAQGCSLPSDCGWPLSVMINQYGWVVTQGTSLHTNIDGVVTSHKWCAVSPYGFSFTYYQYDGTRTYLSGWYNYGDGWVKSQKIIFGGFDKNANVGCNVVVYDPNPEPEPEPTPSPTFSPKQCPTIRIRSIPAVRVRVRC